MWPSVRKQTGDMNKSQLAILTDAERLLVLETTPQAMADPDEDDKCGAARPHPAGPEQVHRQYRRWRAAGDRAAVGQGVREEPARPGQGRGIRGRVGAGEQAVVRVPAGQSVAELKAERLGSGGRQGRAETVRRQTRRAASKANGRSGRCRSAFHPHRERRWPTPVRRAPAAVPSATPSAEACPPSDPWPTRSGRRCRRVQQTAVLTWPVSSLH